MEDNIQTIVIVIISVFLLFIFPVYMAYEKKDDISYALAMRYTQDLVDEVRSKGYISKNMYDDYRARLKVTGNSYDIDMTHEYNRYDPITNYYIVENGKYTLVKTTPQEAKENILSEAIQQGKLAKGASKEEQDTYIASVYGYEKILSEDTYQISKQVYTTEYIENVLNSERKLLLNSNATTVKCSDSDTSKDGCEYAYIMNVGDNFNIIIKNTNTTLATVIYNMVTANTLDNNTRIYVNYGGAILSNKWYGDIDYAKMDHEKIYIDKLQVIQAFYPEQHYETSKAENNVENKFINYDGEYAIAFDVKPTEVTELRQKGKLNVADYTGYNFAIGNNKKLNENSMMSVSVGINGITLITNTSVNLKAITTEGLVLPMYEYKVEKTRTEQEEYTYIDEETGEEKTGVRNKVVTYYETHTAQRKITEYKSLRVRYTSKGKILVTLVGKAGVGNVEKYITVSDSSNLLYGLDKTINNPTSSSVTGAIGQVASRGTNVTYSINITNTTINVSANKYVSDEMTILSYPVAIADYVNVKIEIKERKDAEDIYTAVLYLDGERVDESIDMQIIPKINVVGKTIIGNETRYFDGYISNVELYN